jgi:hypothetical protein
MRFWVPHGPTTWLKNDRKDRADKSAAPLIAENCGLEIQLR